MNAQSYLKHAQHCQKMAEHSRSAIGAMLRLRESDDWKSLAEQHQDALLLLMARMSSVTTSIALRAAASDPLRGAAWGVGS